MFDFFKSVFTVPIIIIALVILIIIIRKSSAKRAAAAAQARRQQEARERQERERAEAAERDRQYQQEREKRISETEEAIRNNPGCLKYRLEKIQTETNSSVLNITEFTPISKKRYVAFDLETTGLDYQSDAIVEIGAVRVENGEITEEFHQLINPGFKMPYEASAVNHITDSMLIDQPKMHQVLPAFIAFIGDDILAAHNVRFDLRFLCNACMNNRFKAPSVYFDTMSLSRYWPEATDKKLSSLIAAAGIENDDAHRALGDARAVAKLITATNKKRNESKKH